tara:strand:+ start:2118 stop:2420 length:303 start_codon:yes stop_codon:yes gene_type:complete
MKIVSPNDANHTIELTPRFYGSTTVVFTLRNETTDVSSTVANTYSYTDGISSLAFTYTFVEADKFQMTITEGTDIVFRGKLLATTQTPQDYSLTDGEYIY